MPVWDPEYLSAPHTQREIGMLPGDARAENTAATEVVHAAAVLERDPAAAARFVVDWMERETGLPFGDMIGRVDAEEILARAGRERGAGIAAFRKISWPVCADCFRHVEPGSAVGHLPWCPYAGDLDFPRHEG